MSAIPIHQCQTFGIGQQLGEAEGGVDRQLQSVVVLRPARRGPLADGLEPGFVGRHARCNQFPTDLHIGVDVGGVGIHDGDALVATGLEALFDQIVFDQPAAHQAEIVVIRRDAFENPQQARVVFFREIRRREDGRLHALHVPQVEVLVADEAEEGAVFVGNALVPAGKIGRASCRERV